MPIRCVFLLALAVVGSVAGCREKQDLEGDTVRVSLPDERVELDVISCGLDDGVFVLGAASADAFVQLLVVTRPSDGADPDDDDPDDDEVEVEVDVARSAVSVERARVGVLGAGSGDLLEVDPGVAGEITSATIRGDRIDVEARARDLSGAGGGEAVPIEVAARCPAAEDFA